MLSQHKNELSQSAFPKFKKNTHTTKPSATLFQTCSQTWMSVMSFIFHSPVNDIQKLPPFFRREKEFSAWALKLLWFKLIQDIWQMCHSGYISQSFHTSFSCCLLHMFSMRIKTTYKQCQTHNKLRCLERACSSHKSSVMRNSSFGFPMGLLP